MIRAWDIQLMPNAWISLGFHIDHHDPSFTVHLPGAVLSFGKLKQPGFPYSLRRHVSDNEEIPSHTSLDE